MRKILLVEDEEFISLSESRLLKKHGFSVLCASSGEEAVRMFHEDPEIDLVLMDIDLGRGMDGAEAAKLMLKEREVPVVFLSSHTKSEIVARTEEIGSYGFIVKTSGDAVILASIRVAFRLFDAKRVLDEQAQKLQATNEELHSTLEELQATNEEYEAVNEGLLRAQDEILEREEELKILQSVSMLLASSDDLIDALEMPAPGDGGNHPVGFAAAAVFHVRVVVLDLGSIQRRGLRVGQLQGGERGAQNGHGGGLDELATSGGGGVVHDLCFVWWFANGHGSAHLHPAAASDGTRHVVETRKRWQFRIMVSF